MYNVDIVSNLKHFCKDIDKISQNEDPNLKRNERTVNGNKIRTNEQRMKAKVMINQESVKVAHETHVAVLYDLKKRMLSLEERSYLLGAYFISKLRSIIFQHLGYTMSAGIANNKLMAKLASSRNKPNKLTIGKSLLALLGDSLGTQI